MALRISAVERDLIDELAEDVVGAAEEVAGALRGEFTRGVYERALACELGVRGRSVKTHVSQSLLYKGAVIGGYCADMLVAGRLAVNVDGGRDFSPGDWKQCQKYLEASGVRVGLLLRFDGGHVLWEVVMNPDLELVAA